MRKWLAEDEKYLQQNYGKMPLKDIAAELNRTEKALYHKVYKLGLNADTRANKAWTQKELIILEENWGKINLQALCKKLDRPVNGVIYQSMLLRLGPTKYAQGYYTARQLAGILGVTEFTILYWIKNYGLPATMKTTRKKKKFYQIDPEKFEEWAQTQNMPKLKDKIS